MRAVKALRLFGHYVRFNLRAGMEYKVSFVVQVFGMILNNSAFIFFWLILFDRIGGSINGYGFREVMFLWALAAAGFGLSVVLLGNANQLSRIIYQGELDVYLLQPKPVLPNVLASRMVVSGWGDFSYGIVLFAITQSITPFRILLFILFAILACLLFTAIRVIYHSVTFYFGNAEDFANTATEFSITFAIYPGSIFDGPVRVLLFTAVPVAFISYIPAEIFANFDPWRLLLVIAADAAFVLAAIVMFARGLRMYESGNRMGTRL